MVDVDGLIQTAVRKEILVAGEKARASNIRTKFCDAAGSHGFIKILA